METLNITKVQARLAIYHYDYINNYELKDRDISYLENESKSQSRTAKFDSNKKWIKKQENYKKIS